MVNENLAMKKMRLLQNILRGYRSVLVAFSGGVDSTFLLKAASDVLGDSVTAVIADLVSLPEREREEAEAFCARNEIRHFVLPVNVLDIPEFSSNQKDRCYHCKRAVFQRILRAAGERCMSVVAEGSNLDDEGDYRPGMRAVKELGIVSPLRECGLTKEEIRYLSREMGLSTWNKPSLACLASRFPYGEGITREKLAMVEMAERFLTELGVGQVRVRMHGRMARIELEPEDFPKVMAEPERQKVVRQLRELGFTYVSLDLTGYRTGSLNEEKK